MRILMLANSDSGLYEFRLELIERLVKEHEVYISLPYGEMIPKLQAMGCSFIDTAVNRRGMNPLTDLKLLLKYRQIIKSIKPDVVLTYTIKPNVYGGIACRMLRIPYLTNVTGLGSAFENEGLLKEAALRLYKAALKKAACVFFQNEENMQYFRSKNVVGGHHRLIPGSGVNLTHYTLLEYPEGEPVNFMFIGRLMKDKGIDHYLEAAEYIRKKYQFTEFHILGSCEAEYEEKLKELKDRDIVTYHGRQDDVCEFHKISSCTIHPSYSEGMSNVLLESAACGRPIIASNISGCKEIVDDGVNGFLFEKKNSRDLIEKIERFLALDGCTRRTMGRNGRTKVENGFDRRIVVDAYMDELKKLNGKKTRTHAGSAK
jgi:glycosyltransferase involved in cell wall biosynthesis